MENVRKKKILLKILPLFIILISFLMEYLIPLSSEINDKELYYLEIFLGVSFLVIFIEIIVSFFNRNFNEKYINRVPKITAFYVFLSIYNLITAKLSLVPVSYFPYPDKILAVFISDRDILIKSMIYSFRLQILGIIVGGFFGIVTGVAIGWNEKLRYWLNPIIKILGPIPSVAFLPIALYVFSSFNDLAPSVFLISVSVWFSVSVLTSSGIQNIEKGYFEVAKTLGANNKYEVFKVAIPGAMPSIFVGFFNGICASFITLFTAEVIGAKYGIGWYINWQRETFSYANVYAGLILIAIFCSCFVFILFKLRDKLLDWQKGVIKW